MKCYCGNEIKNMYSGRKYCSITCRSKDKQYRDSISTKKTMLYSDKDWKRDVEDKKKNTTFSNFGVEYPMQNVDVFLRQQSSCFKKDVNGLHGYEPVVYPFLKNLYHDLELGSAYLKLSNSEIKWDNNGKSHRSYPDFFSQSANLYIEIKSRYTYNNHVWKIMKCKERLQEMKIGYSIIIVNPRRSFEIYSFNTEYIND